jgi:hypothetical protein
MMSRKTLLGEPTKWASVFPKKEIVSDILSHPNVYNCLHYADYGDLGVDANLVDTLHCVADYGGSHLDAIQLDMIWPDPRALERFKKAKECELILQIGKRAFRDISSDASLLVSKLGEYNGIVERLLFDMSGGEGREMQTEWLLSYLRIAREHFSGFSFGVAGGLGPYSVHLLEPLLSEFPHISIDAQGQLRNSANSMDPIDWWRAEKYIEEAMRILDR